MTFHKIAFSGFLIICVVIFSCGRFASKIDYNAQVKPILNKNCLSCHGGVKKQGGFSLLFREEALAKTKSGKPGIVPGDASASEMYKRLVSADPEERMPHHKDPLKQEEIAVIKKWIDEGAVFSTHWAYKPLEKVSTPSEGQDWAKNYIDNHIYKNANKAGLEMSPEAKPEVLARRVSLDLVGFPLDNPEKTSYLKSPNDKTYEAYVNSLLASKHFGEKWTSMWLDLARYADTKGYERDANREIWKYRDWLIDAFNSDLPYDKFLQQQIAGDLLENADESTFIATAYHRNTMTNDEGGTDNEEFRVAANIDRVNTTWETLMSTTFACVQCHSHPYDPFTHEEYYKFMSFFNNSRDEDTFDDYPRFRHYNVEDRKKLDETKSWMAKNISPQEKKEIELFLNTLQPSYNSLTMVNFENSELADTKFLAFRHPSSACLKNVDMNQKKNLLLRYNISTDGGLLEIRTDSKTGPIIAQFKVGNKVKDKNWNIAQLNLKETKGIKDLYFIYKNPNVSDLKNKGLLIDWLYFQKDLPGKDKPGYKAFQNNYWSLINAKPEVSTPVFVENPNDFKRKNQVFERGSFLARTKEVSPGIPSIFSDVKKLEDRLDLAMWLTSDKNPLVSRTMVNRIWEQVFGTGIVETLEDMGSQGAKPINQALLDDMSWRFMKDYKWSMKTLLKSIVVSSTYRQSSEASEKNLEKDKFNVYMARGPRIRLSGEQIRDQALYISGALNLNMYGPPVMPYQPEGIWSSPYNGAKWIMDSTGNQYRRSLYTFWKRTNAYPSLTTFDGVGREVCISRRIRTNTPLQAFVTLNDSSYIDMSRIFAKDVLSKNKGNISASIKMAYFKATGKSISQSKFQILVKLFDDAQKKYKKNPKLIKELNNSSDAKMAAMILVCNSILNLDEVISKS
jgi:hypothetical protein